MKLSTINFRLISGNSHIFRRFFTAEKTPTIRREFNKHTLYHKLSNVWSNGKKVSEILDQLSKNGSIHLPKSDLVHCIKKLRSYGHHQRCLEILEWMEKWSVDYSEYSLYLGIVYKVKGIHEAEKYFDSLPLVAKNKIAYGTLLNCYCSEKMIDEALALFKKMDEMNYANNDMVFTNLMCLYIKVDQPEKVPSLVEEMKRRNIRLSTVSYITWIHSYACLNDLEGIERVMEEVQKENAFKYEWRLYNSFASAYIKVGQYQKAETFLKMVEKILDDSVYPDRIAYQSLISLYASAGNLDSVNGVWGKLKSKFKACNNTSYLTMLNALSKLGNVEHLNQCFKEWNSRYKSYDVRLPTVVIGAYLRHDMLEEAELLLKDATDRAGQKLWNAHVFFMDYFLGKHQIDSALRHLEVAIANQWKPPAEKLDDLFEYFTKEKDVDGAGRFCQILERGQRLPSTAYCKLLRTYAATGRTAPEMRRRMVQDGSNIGTEHEELLEKVCLN